MLALLLLLPIFSLSKIEFPKISFLFVDEDMTQADITELKEFLNLFKSKAKEACEEVEEKDICKAAIEAFLGIEGSNGEDISKAISKINKKTDILFYAGTSIDQTIDFSKLKSKMCVIMISPSSYSLSVKNAKKIDFYIGLIKRIHKKMMKVSFDGTQDSMIKLASSFDSKKNKKPKSKTYANIAGNIKDKVSFLTISDYYVTFVNSNLNCHSLYLYDSQIDPQSKEIKTTFLYSNTNSHSYFFNIDEADYRRIGTFDQYTLVLELYSQEYTIAYKSDSWCVEFGSYYDKKKYCFPYQLANTFGLYALSQYILIRLDDSILKEEYKQLNITISYNKITAELPIFNDDRTKVVIDTSGNWDSVTNKPKIIVTTHNEDFKIVKSDECKLNFETQEIYTYKVKKSGPNVGMIVGIVIACVVVIAAIVVLVVILYLRKKKKSQEMSENEGTAQETKVENT